MRNLNFIILALIFTVSTVEARENRYAEEIKIINKSNENFVKSAKKNIIFINKVKKYYEIIHNRIGELENLNKRYKSRQDSLKGEDLSKQWVVEKYFSELLEQETLEVTAYIGYFVDLLKKEKINISKKYVSQLESLYYKYEDLRLQFVGKKAFAEKQLELLRQQRVQEARNRRENQQLLRKSIFTLGMVSSEVKTMELMVKRYVYRSEIDNLLLSKEKLESLKYVLFRYIETGLIYKESHVFMHSQIEDRIDELLLVINAKLYGFDPSDNKRMGELRQADEKAIERGTSVNREIERLEKEYEDWGKRSGRHVSSSYDEYVTYPREKKAEVTYWFTAVDFNGNPYKYKKSVEITFSSDAEASKKLHKVLAEQEEIAKKQAKEYFEKNKLDRDGPPTNNNPDAFAILAGHEGGYELKMIPTESDQLDSFADSIIVESEEEDDSQAGKTIPFDNLERDINDIDSRLEDFASKESNQNHKKELNEFKIATSKYIKNLKDYEKKIKDAEKGVTSFQNKVENILQSIRTGMSTPEEIALDTMDIGLGLTPIVGEVWDVSNFITAVATDYTLTGDDAKGVVNKTILGAGALIPFVSGTAIKTAAKNIKKLYKHVVDKVIDTKLIGTISDIVTKKSDNVDDIIEKVEEVVDSTQKSGMKNVDEVDVFAKTSKKISQKQLRHIKGNPRYRGGGYLDNVESAQKVLDAYKGGEAKFIGKTREGHVVIKYDGVTGTNVNPGAGFPNQATNVFMIKGTAKPSVVPTSPTWKP